MFPTRDVEKIKTHSVYTNFFFRKSFFLWVSVEKGGAARQATDDNITWSMRSACCVTKATYINSEYVIPYLLA